LGILNESPVKEANVGQSLEREFISWIHHLAGQLPPQAVGRGSHAQATDRYTRRVLSTTAGRDVRPPLNCTAVEKGIATMLTLYTGREKQKVEPTLSKHTVVCEIS
jgi:hypothetical protein